MKKILMLALLYSFAFIVNAQEKVTEGVITLKQTYKSNDEATQAQFAMMGDIVTTTFFKEKKSRIEMSNPMSGDVVIITDSKSMESLTLLDNPMMGQKYQKQTIDLPKDKSDDINIEEGSETKTILGYKCKQKLMTISEGGNDIKMVMYTTDKIAPVLSQQNAQYSNKLGGFPMYTEMSMTQGEVVFTIISEVTEVKSESVDDSKFSLTPPEGYTKMEGM
ncbi:hypothetical protein BWZ20_12510 [Winogradskyella sp. J14-2]|uniref:hypothetical protein n=1 Tax=Winogradskyella sp. J14-2 TaxID=1936080 RepID=UPI000972CED7|nr:hypothetical protein [Winogradskyella sp. J14-2]APY09073.1 hypothetical protein BWZ20_12510 [Winogradskyella sp. J14-2]